MPTRLVIDAAGPCVKMVGCQFSLPSHYITVLLVFLFCVFFEQWLGSTVNASYWGILTPLISNLFSYKLLNVADEEFVHQAATPPTRYRSGHLPSPHGLVFSKNIRVFCPPITSQHWVKVAMQTYRSILPRPTYQLEIYPNQNGVKTKLTYRGVCVLLTVSTGPQYQ